MALVFDITHSVFILYLCQLHQHEDHTGTNKDHYSGKMLVKTCHMPEYPWQFESYSPSLPHCLLVFMKHSFTVHLPFPLSLSFHIWPCVFLFPPLLFLFGRFNAFTPPLHSCACFIHQSQHYLTNPTASSFAPLHLPLHHPPPTHGLSLEACTLPDTLLLSSLWLSPWRSHSYSYVGDLLWDLIVQGIHTYIYTHIHTMDLGEVINSLEMLGFSFFL